MRCPVSRHPQDRGHLWCPKCGMRDRPSACWYFTMATSTLLFLCAMFGRCPYRNHRLNKPGVLGDTSSPTLPLRTAYSQILSDTPLQYCGMLSPARQREPGTLLLLPPTTENLRSPLTKHLHDIEKHYTNMLAPFLPVVQTTT